MTSRQNTVLATSLCKMWIIQLLQPFGKQRFVHRASDGGLDTTSILDDERGLKGKGADRGVNLCHVFNFELHFFILQLDMIIGADLEVDSGESMAIVSLGVSEC